MSVKDNLIAARALIDTPEKWGKGRYESIQGCYCALGAIAIAIGAEDGTRVRWFSDRMAIALNDALESELPPLGGDVISFNDHPDTTHEMIMQLFDRAIAAQEASNDRE